MDKVIIDAWERQRVREDDDAYEGRFEFIYVSVRGKKRNT
jgi:hypothetical protein